MNEKIEKNGKEILKKYLGDQKFNDVIDNRASCEEYGCDIIASKNGEKYYIELKSSNTGRDLEFAHQTIFKMSEKSALKNLIIAYVSNLSSEKPKIEFFKMGCSPHLYIVPRFVIQHRRGKVRLHENINDAIEADIKEVDWQKIEETIKNARKIMKESGAS